MTASSPHGSSGTFSPIPAWLAAILISALGFLPIANWIRNGHEAPWYGSVASVWLSGSCIAVGTGIVLAILSRRLPIWRAGAFDALVGRAHGAPRVTGLVLALAAFGLYIAIAISVFSGRPLHIDELSQLFQARLFAEGKPWLDGVAYSEFTSSLNILDVNGRRFSQFPLGGPLMLIPGVLVGAPWIIGPSAGAISVALFWAIARRIERRPGVALGAAVLFAFAPFVAFMAGSHMNHVTALMWILVAAYALVRQTGDKAPHPGFAALCGLALGIVATIRPVDAIAFALPAAVWMLSRAAHNHRAWVEVASAGLALAVPAGAVLLYNRLTTGHALLFAYEYQWGKDHGLGFHRAPWGFAHTPARGLELLSLYLLRLQTYLFETGIPSLTAAVAGLALARRISAFDRYLLACGALLLALYFAYWHDGFYLGPRFVYLLAPLLVLWTARFPSALAARWPRATLAHRAVWYSLAVAAGMSLTLNLPRRTREYGRGLTSMRRDYVGIPARAGVHDALIFVRESWGSQLVARMWAAGVPHSQTEMLYRGVDTCQLEGALTTLEAEGLLGDAASSRLLPLLRDSARVVRSDLSPDQSERVLPGSIYDEQCRRRLLEDRAGFTLFVPLLVVDWRSNVYARDLHGRDTLLVQRYPGRPLYLLRPVNADAGAPLVLKPLRRDSLAQVWNEGKGPDLPPVVHR